MKQLRGRVMGLLLGAFGALTFAPVAFAQEADPGADPAEARSQAFRAVTGPVTEDVPGGALLVAAYVVIFLLLLLYVVRLVRLQNSTDAEVARLSRALEAKTGAPPEGKA